MNSLTLNISHSWLIHQHVTGISVRQEYAWVAIVTLLFVPYHFLRSHFLPYWFLVSLSLFSLSCCFAPPANATQRLRQLRQLVNSDKEAESTSHFDIYRVIFTTRLYNLCPFTPFLYSVSSHTFKLDGNFYMLYLTERSQESITVISYVHMCLCENVKSEVFKVGRPAVINVTEDTNA